MFSKLYNLFSSFLTTSNKEAKSLVDYLAYWAQHNASGVFLVSSSRSPLLYEVAYEKVRTLQREFSLQGLCANERVGLFISIHSEQALASLALSDQHAIALLPSEITLYELEKTIVNLSLTGIATDKPNDALLSMAERISCKIFVVESTLDHPTGFFEIVQVIGVSNSWKKSVAEDNFSFIFQTSGTTDQPKIIAYPMNFVVKSCERLGEALQLKSGELNLNFLNFHTTFGSITGFYLPLIFGGTVVFPGKYSRNLLLEWVSLYKPSWFAASPAIYTDFMKLSEQELSRLENSSLRFVRIGSAPASLKLLQKIERIFGVPVIEAYGMTETLMITCNPIKKHKLGSVGIPNGTKVKIVNDRNHECRKYVSGNILVKGDMFTKTFLSEGSNLPFKDGWFITGDTGYRDKDGYIFLTGRTKEMINKGGSKVYPLEVEQVLLQKDEILEASVFGVSHATLGEEVVAAVVTKDHAPIDEISIRKYLREKLELYKVPVRVLVVQEFPRNENGKILKQKLSEKLVNELQDVFFTVIEGTKQTKAEALLARLVTEILELKQPDLSKDFISLGATSIDIQDMLVKLKDALGTEIGGNEFIEAENLKSFAAYLETKYSFNIDAGQKNSFVQSAKEETSLFSEKLTSSNQYLKNQLVLVKQWAGIRKNENSMVIGKSLSGKKKPLFWCFQSYEEFEMLAIMLGKDQPLYGMRSGHMIVKMNEVEGSGIAQHYAQELMDLKPNGTFIVGGNCQGGKVAWLIANELIRQNREVELLFLMEINPKEKYDGRIALLFGSESTKINPYLCEKDPESVWNSIYCSYSVDIIDGQHGHYFTPQNIGVLTSKLKNRLETCVAPQV